MAWITPVTDRTDGSALMTYQDMDRITGNLKWLYDACVSESIPISGSAISKTSWSRNDIIDVTFWAELLVSLDNVCNAISYTPAEAATDALVWNNINIVETIERDCYDVLASYIYVPRLNHYVGDKLGTSYLYAGDEFNAGGRYS